MQYVCGFNKAGNLMVSVPYVSKEILENANNMLPNIESVKLLDDNEFKLCQQGYYLGEDGKLYPPIIPLAEAKEEKITELKNMRDTLEVEPIEYNGNYFDYDEKARDRINAGIISLDVATKALGKEATISWTTADNTEAIVTANDLRGVVANVAVRSDELHIHYRTKRELVDNATTVEEVEAISW